MQRQIEHTAKCADSGGGLSGSLLGSIPIVGDVVHGGIDLLTANTASGWASTLRQFAQCERLIAHIVQTS